MQKSFSLFLFATILLQSCHAYYNTSVSLNEAYDSKGGVKVTNTMGKNLFYNHLELKDSIYYGVKEDKDVRVSTSITGFNVQNTTKEDRLSSAQISGIYLQNSKKSTAQTVLLGVSGGIAFTILILSVVN